MATVERSSGSVVVVADATVLVWDVVAAVLSCAKVLVVDTPLASSSGNAVKVDCLWAVPCRNATGQISPDLDDVVLLIVLGKVKDGCIGWERNKGAKSSF